MSFWFRSQIGPHVSLYEALNKVNVTIKTGFTATLKPWRYFSKSIKDGKLSVALMVYLIHFSEKREDGKTTQKKSLQDLRHKTGFLSGSKNGLYLL